MTSLTHGGYTSRIYQLRGMFSRVVRGSFACPSCLGVLNVWEGVYCRTPSLVRSISFVQFSFSFVVLFTVTTTQIVIMTTSADVNDMISIELMC